MPLSQSSFTSQILFALVSGFGVSSMHYCGMFAASFYTPLEPEARHPEDSQTHTLPWSIAVIAFASCLISYVLLAHTVTSSRDELVEAIRTKRALWRTTAEKEAAVRSDKMKMDFISVASHEIRVSSAFSYSPSLLTACYRPHCMSSRVTWISSRKPT